MPEGSAVFEIEPEIAAGFAFGLRLGDFSIGEGEEVFCACFGVSPVANGAPEEGDEKFYEVKDGAEVRAFADGGETRVFDEFFRNLPDCGVNIFDGGGEGFVSAWAADDGGDIDPEAFGGDGKGGLGFVIMLATENGSDARKDVLEGLHSERGDWFKDALHDVEAN